jgi:hypothetical protein
MGSDTLVATLAPFGFAGAWIGVLWLIGQLSGWARLATRYRTREPRPLGAMSFVTASLQGVRMNNSLIVGIAEDGLDLRAPLMFRPGHPPLRIPWSVIRVEGESSGVFTGEVTHLRLGEDGPLLRLPSEIWARSEGLRSS